MERIGAHIPKDAEKELEAVAMNYSADRRITIPRKSTAILHLQKLRQSLPKFKASVAEIDELAVQTMARSNPNPSHIDWLYDTVSASRNPGCFSSHWSVLISISGGAGCPASWLLFHASCTCFLPAEVLCLSSPERWTAGP